MIYNKEKTRNISFPLGGIGTGCIGLAGNGELNDWEIFNRPNKNSRNGYSHFAIKARIGNKSITFSIMPRYLKRSFICSTRKNLDVRDLPKR